LRSIGNPIPVSHSEQDNVMPTPTEVLSRLHAQLIDAARGYEDAEKAIRQPEISGLCSELRKVHIRHAHEIAGLLAERGARPESDGTFMSVVHKAVINARVALTADDASILPGLREGEKRIAAAYDDALLEAEIAATDMGAVVDTLRNQRVIVVQNITRIDTVKAVA
jgi:uncharacterized protein (TIGR02284 family)